LFHSAHPHFPLSSWSWCGNRLLLCMGASGATVVELSNASAWTSKPESSEEVTESSVLGRSTGKVAASQPPVADDRHWQVASICVRLKGEFPHSRSTTAPAKAAAVNPNAVRTCRYGPATWPLALLWQFNRLANVYFLFIAVSVFLPCPPRGKGMLFGFCLSLLATMVRDLVEDLRRRADDRLENKMLVSRYLVAPNASRFVHADWQQCRVGDIVLIKEGDAFPADVLVAATADEDGMFYVSTASLDGETSLKEKQIAENLQRLASKDHRPVEAAAALLAVELDLVVNPPTTNPSDMQGSLSVGTETLGLDIRRFATRGSVLRNTPWVIGVCCYVGGDTKVRLNATQKVTAKHSDMHHAMNRCAWGFIAFVVAVSLYMAVKSSIRSLEERRHGAWALCGDDFFIVFWRNILIYYAVLAVSLYMLLEILKYVCRRQIDRDGMMANPVTGELARMRTSELVEELGQVDIVLSDKTGTLTANDMRLLYCCVGETPIGPLNDEAGLVAARAILQGGALQASGRALFKAMALCHNVRPDEHGQYRGESPDEVALVRAARDVGVSLLGRRKRGGATLLTVECPDGTEEHPISCTIPFTPNRARMSVVCPAPQGGALVITKGADTVIESLLVEPLPEAARKSNEAFACRGLRTLVVAHRRMDAAALAAWEATWTEASSAMEDRDTRLDAAAALLEREMEYVGLTAMEDRLQEGVPESVAALRAAGLRIWILTGDKAETAEEVARSCRILEEGEHVTRIVGMRSAEKVAIRLREALTEGDPHIPRVLLIDGNAVRDALADRAAREALCALGPRCRSCVACRLSPSQKKELVELAREANSTAITLAIGDGANDVPMIQAAHLGIGIRGQEGVAAVQASDVAISQFRFLSRLLLTHGVRMYRRIALFLLWFNYKQLLKSWGNIIYGHTSSRQRSCWPDNVEDITECLQELAAVFFIACDRDVSDMDAIASPELYAPGPSRLLFNLRVFGLWMVSATWHGVIAWVVPIYALTSRADRQEQSMRFWSASIVAYTIITAINYLKLLISDREHMTRAGIVTIVALFAAYFFVLLLLATLGLSEQLASGALRDAVTSWRHVLCVLLVPCAAVVPDATWAVIAARWRTSHGGGAAVGGRWDVRCQDSGKAEAGFSLLRLRRLKPATIGHLAEVM